MVVVHGLPHEIRARRPDSRAPSGPLGRSFPLSRASRRPYNQTLRMPIVPKMVKVLRRALDIHVARVPVAVHRHALRAPVAQIPNFASRNHAGHSYSYSDANVGANLFPIKTSFSQKAGAMTRTGLCRLLRIIRAVKVRDCRRSHVFLQAGRCNPLFQLPRNRGPH